MTIGCVWAARLYFTNGAYAAGIEQWIVRDMPNFVDLIIKLGWMFWAIIWYAYLLVCFDHRLILCNLFWGLVPKGRGCKPWDGCMYEAVLPDVLYVIIWIYLVTWSCLIDFIFMHALLT